MKTDGPHSSSYANHNITFFSAGYCCGLNANASDSAMAEA
jgi:hypothetical protein